MMLSLVAVLTAQSIRLLYGMVPSARGVYFCIFVFTLSKGRLMVAAIPPEIKLDSTHVNTAFSGPSDFSSLSLDSSYDTSMPRLRDIALTTVGAQPFHRDRKPSSLTILENASMTFL